MQADVLLVLAVSVELQLLLVGMVSLLQCDQGLGQQLVPVPLPLLGQYIQLCLGEALQVPHTFMLHLEDQREWTKASVNVFRLQAMSSMRNSVWKSEVASLLHYACDGWHANGNLQTSLRDILSPIMAAGPWGQLCVRSNSSWCIKCSLLSWLWNVLKENSSFLCEGCLWLFIIVSAHTEAAPLGCFIGTEGMIFIYGLIAANWRWEGIRRLTGFIENEWADRPAIGTEMPEAVKQVLFINAQLWNLRKRHLYSSLVLSFTALALLVFSGKRVTMSVVGVCMHGSTHLVVSLCSQARVHISKYTQHVCRNMVSAVHTLKCHNT